MWIEIILTLLLLYAIWNIIKKPSGYPPGPWGLPLIGYLPFGMKHFRAKLKELQEKHYPVFSWRIGNQLLIFVCDYKLVKEAFQSQNYVDRPKMTYFSAAADQETGITTVNGDHWHNMRKFTLRHLRNLGMGTSRIASGVQREANELVKVLKKQSGKTAPVPEEITTAFLNILLQMVSGKRYEFEDDVIVRFSRETYQLQKSLSHLPFLDLFPFLDPILPDSVMNFLMKKNAFTKITKSIETIFEKEIDEHVATLDEKNPRDYIDEYLIELEKRKDDPKNTMTKRDLLVCVGDLFRAALETTNATLHWSIFHLAKYQQIQKELQKEIDNVLPNAISPTYEDKSKMPKMEAFITEILRVTTVVEFGVPRTVSSYSKMAGYDIPKGSFIIGAAKMIHCDKRNFDSPESFNPQRFIDSNGKFSSPKQDFLPFGIGKRQCLGESLARMEIFIFLVTMLQHVEFHPPPNKSINLNPIDIPVLTLPHFRQDILIKTRE